MDLNNSIRFAPHDKTVKWPKSTNIHFFLNQSDQKLLIKLQYPDYTFKKEIN